MPEPWQNPYVPGAATPPPALTGRDDWLARFDQNLRGLVRGQTIQHECLWGPRGMGKTVLLERIAQMGGERSVVSRRVEATGDNTFAAVLAHDLGAMARDLASRGAALRRVRDAVEAITVTVGAGPIKAELTSTRATPLDRAVDELLRALGELAHTRRRGVLLLLDEAQFIAAADLRAVARGLQSCAAARLPVLMVAAGLPDTPEHIRTSVTYGERYRFAELGPISVVASRVALESPALELGVRFDPEGLDALVAASAGYPYLVQLLGHRAWEAAGGAQVITRDHARRAIPAALDELAAGIFDGRVARIGAMERTYLEAMARLGDAETSGAAVAAALGRPAQSLSRVRQSLISKGLIAAVGNRGLRFTLPHFAAYLRSHDPGT